MTISTLTGFIAGTLQFVVAAYALRLNRRYGTARVGWSLFCAFTLLAILHLAQVVIVPAHAAISFSAEVEVTYALISVLLLTGMTHLESMIKERIKMEQKEQQLRVELELEVKKKTSYLTRAIEGLQEEIDKRKRVETAMQTADSELRAASSQIELAGMANSVLQSVGVFLSNAGASADRIAALVQQCKDLSAERSGIESELDTLKTNLEKVTEMQRNYVRFAGANDVPGITTTWNSDALDLPEYRLVSSMASGSPEMLEIKL